MRALTSPPHPPFMEGGSNYCSKIMKLSVLLAQLVRVLSSQSKDHGFNSLRVLFHFPMYMYMYMVEGEGRCIMLHYRPRAVMSSSYSPSLPELIRNLAETVRCIMERSGT